MASIVGTPNGDTLFGTPENDLIQGLEGNDLVLQAGFNAWGGHDVVEGGEGADTVWLFGDYRVTRDGLGGVSARSYDAEGHSTLTSMTSVEFIQLGGSVIEVSSGLGDTWVGSAGADQLFGGQFDDILLSLAGKDIAYGGEGHDELQGGLGADILYGGAGDDLLVGGPGGNTLYGGLGNDTYRIESATDQVVEAVGEGDADLILTSLTSYDISAQAGIERLAYAREVEPGEIQPGFSGTGNSGANMISGGSGADRLFGGGGIDNLFGRDGDDIIDGGQGADFMYGGLGADTYYVDTAFDVVVDDGGDGDMVYSSGANGNGSLSGIEVLILTGQAETAFAMSSMTLLVGNGLNNTLTGVNQVRGEGGDDMIGTYDAYDTGRFYGGDGNDRIYGEAGEDRLFGGDGNDILYADRGGYLAGDGGQEDRLTGGAGDDVFYVRDGLARLIEASDGGHDAVHTTGHTLALGDNIEDLFFDAANSLGNLGEGNDLANRLSGSGGADELRGGKGDDDLSGNDGADTLLGQAGADTLDGGAGNDVLSGGSDGANDRLTGGLGADVFLWRLADGGTDTVTDFSRIQRDLISLVDIDTLPATPADDGFTYIAQTAFHHTGAAEVRWQAYSGGVTVLADVNGDGVADLTIMLEGVTSLATRDFLL